VNVGVWSLPFDVKSPDSRAFPCSLPAMEHSSSPYVLGALDVGRLKCALQRSLSPPPLWPAPHCCQARRAQDVIGWVSRDIIGIIFAPVLALSTPIPASADTAVAGIASDK
jgi:hypothetical protein